jgi:hypothetical protein
MDFEQQVKMLRAIIRAKLGLPPEDDHFQGLIHTTDDRERTKLNTHNVYRHAYMNLLAHEGGEEWTLMGKWAEEERHLFISEDGQRASDFISSLAKKKEQEAQVTTVNVSQPQTPTTEAPKKKGWFR